ncbi:MAG TPA: hypothetical protein VIV40_19370 [Kofleriaceae bacterium]
MMAKLKDVLSSVGGTSASYANSVASRTKDLARTIGPKRGGIALGVLAVAVAAPFLIRFLKARNADLDAREEELEPRAGVRRRRRGPRAHAPTA